MFGRIAVSVAVACTALAVSGGPASAAPVKHSFTLNTVKGVSAHGWWSKGRKYVTVRLCVKDTFHDHRRGAFVVAWSGKKLKGNAIDPGIDAASVSSEQYRRTVCETYSLQLAQHLWVFPGTIYNSAEYGHKNKAKRLY
ncbi:MAG: hypothetical protein JWN52_2269 [Actinomycetia bacterium]|nr:hypothetical protein [Actinomycetes bacterium]